MRVGVVGSANVDLVAYVDRIPEEGETLAGTDFALGCGGKGANQAVAAALCGSEVLMVARVGDDAFGTMMRDNLADHGVDTGHVRETEGTSGVAPILVEPSGANRVIIVPGANDRLSADDVAAAADDLARCDLVVLQLEVPLATVAAAVRCAADRGVPVLLNPAPAHPDLDLDLLADCEFVVPNESELGLLTSMPVASRDEIEAAARTLLDRGVRHVVVTLGSAGALWLTRPDDEVAVVHVDAPAVEVVDSTGAGDAFIGCFAHHWAADRDVEAALRAAVAFAADSVTRRGTQASYARR